MNYSRRKFLDYSIRNLTALGAAGVLGRLSTINASAATASPYRALVCIFLAGGNDCHNTVIPIATSSQGYADYVAARSELALPQAQLLPIAVGANTYALHPKLKEIQSLYNGGKAALLANVGNLVVPTTRAQYLTQQVRVPDALYSHSNQTNQWQTATPSDLASTGWAGRTADLLGQNSQFPMVVNVGGNSVFATGATAAPTTVQGNAAIALTSTSSLARLAAIQQFLTFDNGVKLMQIANGITTRGLNDSSLLKMALAAGVPLQTAFPTTGLGAQLKAIAQIINVRGALGVSRQIFFVSMGGFDTHTSQLPTHDKLLQTLSQGLGAFYNATLEMGVDQSVTAFTNSEFGRSLQPNNAGTDHAWGGHAIIVGGSVHGGTMYGTYPLLAFGGPDDATTHGLMIPTTSVEQYGATLAKWFGVPPGSIPSIFPTVSNFSTADLSFLG